MRRGRREEQVVGIFYCLGRLLGMDDRDGLDVMRRIQERHLEARWQLLLRQRELERCMAMRRECRQKEELALPRQER